MQDIKRLLIRLTMLSALAVSAAASASCTDMVRQGAGNSYLIIDRLGATAGGSTGGTPQTTLTSDVRTKGGVFEDLGTAVFRLALKDPGSPTVPAVATTNAFITVNRFRVTYIRSDGRNTPGVDVPFPFDGALTVTVRAEGTAEAVFSLVRVQAKEEPPLRGLAGDFGAHVISTIAEVTFWGHDQTGRAVSVVGRINVHFADFADPE